MVLSTLGNLGTLTIVHYQCFFKIASLQSNLHTAQSNDLRCTVRLPESDNGSRSELKPAILQGNPAEVSAMFSAKKNRHRMHRVARIETVLETKYKCYTNAHTVIGHAVQSTCKSRCIA